MILNRLHDYGVGSAAHPGRLLSKGHYRLDYNHAVQVLVKHLLVALQALLWASHNLWD